MEMEPLPPLQQIEITRLVKDIPHTSYSEFCVALGSSYTEGQTILASHQSSYKDALMHVLNDWNTKQTDPSQSRSILAGKLEEVDLGALAGKISKGEYRPEVPIPRESDIYSENISESLTVQKCRTILEDKYSNQLCKIQLKPWDKDDYAEFEDMHTVVTIVKKDAQGRDIKEKQILQGSVGKIFSAKVNGNLPTRILISAPAGRGKTTAVAKMAHDWVHREDGSELEDLPLLFVVKFRNTNHTTSIGEAIISQLLSDVRDLTPEGLEEFIRQHQGICHIILDGLDEYAGISSSSNIMRILRREMFPQCRVIVTTRPHLEDIFGQGDLPRVYTKMEIEGFSRENARDYIDRFFTSVQKPMKADGLKVYLVEQPLIEELVKTPLFCLMVCHLWSENLLQRDITTQTALLDQVNIFLMLHANGRTPGLIKTPKQLNQIILKLGEIALTGLLNDAKKLVFSSCDFQRVPSTLDMACALGIVSKTVVSLRRLPQLDEAFSTTITIIEFYHKLAQEHAAGKYLTEKTNRLLLWLRFSKLDRVLRDIKTSIGEYENLIRFACGTKSNLCIRIMESILSNSYLSESERYRILLDCSSESGVNDGNVSSLVRRCVTSRRIILKSPTVYTIVGMRNLSRELKQQVGSLRFEQSVMTAALTDGLWTCLKSFPMLTSLTISDSSIDFPPSPPELPSITELSTERVTSQCYEGLISSLPALLYIDITIDEAEGDITHITAVLRRTGRRKLERIIIHDTPLSFPSRKSGEGGPRLLFVKNGLGPNMIILQHHENALHPEKKGPVEVLESFAFLASLVQLKLEFLGGWFFDFETAFGVKINKCQLSPEMTTRIWSCLSSFTSLDHLNISDSCIDFPPSSPELPSITKISTERVTSKCYEGLISSLPALEYTAITTFDETERDIAHITAGLRRTGGQKLERIILRDTPSLFTSRKSPFQNETEGGPRLLFVKDRSDPNMLILHNHDNALNPEKKGPVEVLESFAFLASLAELKLKFLDGWSFNFRTAFELKITNCQLSPEMTTRMWSCLSSFTSLNHLNISDSSISFPPSPPELQSITELSTYRVTSQCYEGLISSLPALVYMNIIIDMIDDAKGDIAHITAGLRRTGGQKLTQIALHAPSPLPSEKKTVSSKTMRGLGLLIKEHTKNLKWLYLTKVKCIDEDDLVYLIECCRHVNTMERVSLLQCGTMWDGRVTSYLKRHDRKSSNDLHVSVTHDDSPILNDKYWIPHID